MPSLINRLTKIFRGVMYPKLRDSANLPVLFICLVNQYLFILSLNFNSGFSALTPFDFSRYNCISRALEWSSRMYLKDLRMLHFLLWLCSCSFTRFCKSSIPDSNALIPNIRDLKTFLKKSVINRQILTHLLWLQILFWDLYLKTRPQNIILL